MALNVSTQASMDADTIDKAAGMVSEKASAEHDKAEDADAEAHGVPNDAEDDAEDAAEDRAEGDMSATGSPEH